MTYLKELAEVYLTIAICDARQYLESLQHAATGLVHIEDIPEPIVVLVGGVIGMPQRVVRRGEVVGAAISDIAII